jgi:hypothetical protein
MLRRIFIPLVLALGLLAGAGAATPTPTAATVDAPVHNETNLSFFSCAATRPAGFTSGTVNHSHRIAAHSVTGHIDAFDCEVFNNPGLDGAVWRTYYIYDDVPGGGDRGIIGPLNVTTF